jgi:hypothetical protein
MYSWWLNVRVQGRREAETKLHPLQQREADLAEELNRQKEKERLRKEYIEVPQFPLLLYKYLHFYLGNNRYKACEGQGKKYGQTQYLGAVNFSRSRWP